MRELLIQVSEDDCRILHSNDYALCIAKRVEDCDFNVIWQAEQSFTQANIFQWEDKYSIFASRTMQKGEEVFANVSPREISPGQSIILEHEGCFGEAQASGEQDEITMMNQYMPIYPGLCQICRGFSGSTVQAPFYLDPDLSIPGTYIVKPVEKIMIWFAQGAKSGLIISNKRGELTEKAISNYIILDMRDKSKMTIEFDKFVWKIVNN